MQIGIDASRALRARRTGTERYSLEIIRHLLALPESTRHSWRLYADAQPPLELLQQAAPEPKDLDVEWCIMPSRRLWTHGTLAREIMQRPPTVLFVPAHVLPLVLPRKRLPPSVVTVHDLGYHFFPRAHTWHQRLYLKWGTRWNVAAANRLIAVSQATKNDLHRLYAVPPAIIDVVYEAASRSCSRSPTGTPVTPNALTGFRRQPALQRPYALFVGTLQPRKNVATLVKSYARLTRRQDVAWDLVLAGAPGWHSKHLLREIEAAAPPGRVHRLGYVSEPELSALYSGAQIFCFPSCYEGFGLPVLEAQSYGVPVMTSNNSSLPEIAGDAALLVDPTDVKAIADAMLRLSQDETLRQTLITAGYANVKRFSWEKAARETLAVLEKAAGRREEEL